MNVALTKAPTGTAALPLRQVENVKQLFVNAQAIEQLGKVAARHMNPERMMRVMANALVATPGLANCKPMTMLGALMNCATLGLEPCTPLGHAYLIPFGDTVTLIIGYKGYADMARRSGQVKSLHSDVIYSDDELWSYEYGSNMHLRHKPGPREGTKVAAYAHAKLEDGEAFVVIPWGEIMKIRNASQGYKRAISKGKTDTPWIAHEDRMAAKTAVRAMANRGELPLSIEFMQAMEVDEARVDFAAFAADPTGGPIIEGTTGDGDGSQEDEGEPVIESEPAQVAAPKVEEPKPASTRKPAATKPAEAAKPKEEPKPQEDSPAPQEDAPVEQEKPAADWIDEAVSGAAEAGLRTMKKALNTILGDLMDDPDVDGVLAHHAASIETMKETQPTLFAELDKEVAAYRKAAGGAR